MIEKLTIVIERAIYISKFFSLFFTSTIKIKSIEAIVDTKTKRIPSLSLIFVPIKSKPNRERDSSILTIKNE